ncbi:MAG: hypothetical protein V1746_05445 [bacterium]
MPEIAKFTRHGAAKVTPRIIEKLLHQLPILKAEFTQIKAPKCPHLINQLEFLADAVEDSAEGVYRDLPHSAVAAAAFALIYCHRVIDIIPDIDAKCGYVDDSAVVRAVLIEHEKVFAQFAEHLGLDWKKITCRP